MSWVEYVYWDRVLFAIYGIAWSIIIVLLLLMGKEIIERNKK